jgi:ketosteroid isomerase-like protein
MSENVEAVRAVYDRWGKGDFTAGVELFDPDVSLVLRPELPDAGTYRGPAAIAEYMHGFLAPWTRIAIEAEEILEAVDKVLVAVRQHGVGEASGIQTELRYFQLWTFRGGRVTGIESIRERDDALEAAGLE